MIQSAKDVLVDIFNADSHIARSGTDILESSPSFEVLHAFAELLGQEPSEEALQCFIENNPTLLMGMFGWGDSSILAFFN